MTLPRIQPIPPTWRKEPVDDPDWLFDLNYDEFRGLTYIDPGRNRLISRNRHTFDRFDGLTDQLASLLGAFSYRYLAQMANNVGSGRSLECVIRANEGKEFDNDRNPRIAQPP